MPTRIDLPPDSGLWVDLSERHDLIQLANSTSVLSPQGRTLAVEQPLTPQSSLRSYEIRSLQQNETTRLTLENALKVFAISGISFIQNKFIPEQKSGMNIMRLGIDKLVREERNVRGLLVGSTELMDGRDKANMLNNDTVLLQHGDFLFSDFRGASGRQMVSLVTTNLEALLTEAAKNLPEQEKQSEFEYPRNRKPQQLPKVFCVSELRESFYRSAPNSNVSLDEKDITSWKDVRLSVVAEKGQTDELLQFYTVLNHILDQNSNSSEVDAIWEIENRLLLDLSNDNSMTTAQLNWNRLNPKKQTCLSYKGSPIISPIRMSWVKSLRVPQVQVELRLNEAQIESLKEIFQQYLKDVRESLNQWRNIVRRRSISELSKEEKQTYDTICEKRREVEEKVNQKVLEILTEPQLARLQEISLQRNGLDSVFKAQTIIVKQIDSRWLNDFFPLMLPELKLTNEQIADYKSKQFMHDQIHRIDDFRSSNVWIFPNLNERSTNY